MDHRGLQAGDALFAKLPTDAISAILGNLSTWNDRMRLALSSASMLELMLGMGGQWWPSDLSVVDAEAGFEWFLLKLRERGVGLPQVTSLRLETGGIRSRRFGRLAGAAFPGLETLEVRSKGAVDCGVVLARGMTALRTLSVSTDSSVIVGPVLRDLPLADVAISYWSRTKNERTGAELLALARHLPPSVRTLSLESVSYNGDGELRPLLPGGVCENLISLTLKDVWVCPSTVAAAVRGMPLLGILRFDNLCWLDNGNLSEIVEALPAHAGVLELGLAPDITGWGEDRLLFSSLRLAESLCSRAPKGLFNLTLNGLHDVPDRLPQTLRTLKMRRIHQPVYDHQVEQLAACLPALKHMLLEECTVVDPEGAAAAVSAQAPSLVFLTD